MVLLTKLAADVFLLTRRARLTLPPFALPLRFRAVRACWIIDDERRLIVLSPGGLRENILISTICNSPNTYWGGDLTNTDFQDGRLADLSLPKDPFPCPRLTCSHHEPFVHHHFVLAPRRITRVRQDG